MMTISWKITLANLAILPLYALTFRFYNPRVKRASDRVQSQISKISGTVQERLAGIALVKVSGTEDHEVERFRAENEEFYGRVVEQSSISHMVGALSEGLVHTGTMILIGLGGYYAIFGTPPLTAGDVVKLLGWLGILYGPVRHFAEINITYQTSLAALERVFKVFAITPKIVEKRRGAKDAPPCGEVRFEHVKFRYTDDSDESRIKLDDDEPADADADADADTDADVAVADAESDREAEEPRAAAAVVRAAPPCVVDADGSVRPVERARHDRWILDDLDFV